MKLNAELVKLIPEGGTYSVPVTLNDSVKLNFTVDSGAAIVTMPFDVFSTLLRTNTIHKRDILGQKEYQMANGAIEKYFDFNLKKLKIGNQYIYNVRASSSQHMKGSLLLGQSALRKLEPWRLDTQVGVLYIKEKSLAHDGSISTKKYYIVQPGDTLYSISRRNAIDLNELKRLNGIGDDNLISIGQKLHLASSATQVQTSSKFIPFKYKESKIACTNNISMGCINLGLMYEDGNGVKSNLKKAWDYYRKACNLQNARGCFNLGVLLRDGKGVSKDYAKAANIFQLACNNGDAFACSDLGAMYASNDWGIKQNLDIAKSLFKKACDLGDDYGCRNYTAIHRKNN